MPVFHSRWNPDNILLSDLLDRASPLLNPARAVGDDQDLTERVRVPCTPRAGLERNLPAACDIAARPSDVLELVISSYRAKKIAAAACYARFLISNLFNRIRQLLDWHAVCLDLNSEAGSAPRGDSWKKIRS